MSCSNSGYFYYFTPQRHHRSLEQMSHGSRTAIVTATGGTHRAVAFVAPQQLVARVCCNGDDVVDVHPPHLRDVGLGKRNIWNGLLEKGAEFLPAFASGDIDNQQIAGPILEIVAHSIDES